jgi:SAM-dependent methyltransferase
MFAMSNPWAYDLWPARANWLNTAQGDSPWDNIDFHVDLGCGKLPKGRIGVDRYAAPGVAVIADLDVPGVGAWMYSVAAGPGEDAPAVVKPALRGHGLPFQTSSIKSVISHHFFEHVGEGFIALIDEVYRVLEPGGILRAITPLFPSTSAVEDPDHCRYFMGHYGGGGTWDAFCGTPEHHWTESFSVPYCKARFEKVDQDLTPRTLDVSQWWGPQDQREIRVALKAVK